MNTQRTIRSPLDNEHFHVIVIGGGINGVAIARECARAGRRTLLVEQQDFASGTTSRSTRIIHGGLRYLEHGELGLVRESLRERKRLLRQYPHLVTPLQFLLALEPNSQRSALSIRIGLWLYRQMGGKSLAATSEADKHKLERLLDSGRRWSIFNFEDAQCEFPERLVVEWLVEAVESGAVVRNYTHALAVDVRHGRAQGVLLRDQLSKKEVNVHGTWIINATGPWADRVCQRSRIDTKNPMVGGVRGSHIVLPRFAGAPDAAVYSEAVDGRPFFVIPWNEQLLVGTTEAADSEDPAMAQASQEEIQYLFNSLVKLFPRARISQGDIRYAFAGVRPLSFSPKKNAAAVSRKHYLHDHAPDGAAQMISVIGGKLTTAAQLARECAAKIGARPKTSSGSGITSAGLVPQDGLDPLLDRWVLGIAETGSISEESARGIVEWHGKRALNIARMAFSSPELRVPLCPHTVHIVAEAVDGFVNESAVTLADVLLRRVPVAFGPCWSQACSREAAVRLRAVMGWNDGQAAVELEAFENEREAFLRKPPRVEAARLAAAD
jgi:glycerol-3-phosphate dehydrogenase